MARVNCKSDAESPSYTVALNDTSTSPDGASVNVKHRERPLVSLKPEEPKEQNWTTLAESRSADDLSWNEDGLLVRLEGDAGVLCAVKAYRWSKREGGSLVEQQAPSAMDTTE